MSRFQGDYDEWFPNQWWLYEHNLMRAFSSAYGQQQLRDLRLALLALPERRLIHTRLADGRGDVCTLGALAVKRGIERGEWREVVLARLEKLIGADDMEWDSWQVEEQSLAVAHNIGVRRTMAVELAYQNDREYTETPEQRFERVLAWVEALIVEAPVGS